MRLEETWPLASPSAAGLLKMYADFVHLRYPFFVLLIRELCSADSQGVDIFFLFFFLVSIFIIFVSVAFIHFLDRCYTCLRSVLGFVVLSKPLGTLWLVEGFLLVILTKGLLFEAQISLERRSLIRSELLVRLVRSFESLCFLIRAFTCHVALLITFEALAFFLVLILLRFCVGTSDLSEYRWINMHWNGLIVGMTSVSIPA